VPLDAHTVPAYVTSLPTDPKAMLAWLHQGDRGTYNDGSDAMATPSGWRSTPSATYSSPTGTTSGY